MHALNKIQNIPGFCYDVVGLFDAFEAFGLLGKGPADKSAAAACIVAAGYVPLAVSYHKGILRIDSHPAAAYEGRLRKWFMYLSVLHCYDDVEVFVYVIEGKGGYCGMLGTGRDHAHLYASVL